MIDQPVGDAIGITVTSVLLLVAGLPLLLNLHGWRDRELAKARDANSWAARLQPSETSRVLGVYLVPVVFVAFGVIGLISEAAALATGHIV